MSRSLVLVLCLACSSQLLPPVFGYSLYQTNPDNGNPEEALELVPQSNFDPIRGKRGNYKKWGEFAGGFGAAVAPHLWNLWRGKRESLENSDQYDPETLSETLGDYPVRDRRSWFAAASFALPFIVDGIRKIGKRSLDESIQWDPNSSGEFLGDLPVRAKRNYLWNKAKKFGKVVGEYGVPLIGTFAPLAYDHYKNRGKREDMDAFESVSDHWRNQRSTDSVMVSDRRFECDNTFCANKDGWFEFGLCSPQVCRCTGGTAKIEECTGGLVFDALTKECRKRSNTLCGIF